MLSIRALTFAIAVCSSGTSSFADLVSPYGGETAPSFIEMSVEDDHVLMALEIDTGDYPFFVAKDDGKGASLAERTGLTLSVQADGVPLSRITRTIDVRPRTLRKTAATPLVAPRPRSDEVVFIEIEFPFAGQPETITVTPPLDSAGAPLASIGMLAKHKGVPVTDYRYLSQSETIIPNWTDPWFTTFENPNLTRHHKSPLMSFISIEPREVRHEIIFRLRDLENWAQLDFGASKRLTAQDLARVYASAESFIETSNPLVIDGETVLPSSISISRIAIGAEGLQVLPDEAVADRSSMLLGAVLSYPRQSLAHEVALTWEFFPDGVDSVPVTVTDPAGGVPSQANRSSPTVNWTNHLTRWEEPRTSPVVVATAGTNSLSLVSIALSMGGLLSALVMWRGRGAMRTIGSGVCGACLAAAIVSISVTRPISIGSPHSLDETTVHTVMRGLVENMNVAMLEPELAARETAVAPFVSDDNRAEVLAEMQRGLSVGLPSGALAQADEILDLQVETVSQGQSKNAHQFVAVWTASVSGGHWGHLHRRAVTYRSLVDVSHSGDIWRLDGLTVLSAQMAG